MEGGGSKSGAGTILLTTSYGERRNVVVCLSQSSLFGQAGLQYFAGALAERHEESAEVLDFFIRLPAPGSITGVAEIRVDSVADLKSLKCVVSAAEIFRGQLLRRPRPLCLTPPAPCHPTRPPHSLPLHPGNLTPLWCAARAQLLRRRALRPRRALPPPPPRPPRPLRSLRCASPPRWQCPWTQSTTPWQSWLRTA